MPAPPTLWDQEALHLSSGISLSVDRPQAALWQRISSPTDTRCSCGHCTSFPALAGLGLGKPQKVREVDTSHAEVESLTHSSLNGGNVTEAGMGTTLSKWTSGKADILGMGQP